MFVWKRNEMSATTHQKEKSLIKLSPFFVQIKFSENNLNRIDSDAWIKRNSFRRVVRFGAIAIERGQPLVQHRQLVVMRVAATVIYAIVNWNQLFSIIVKVQQLFSIKVNSPPPLLRRNATFAFYCFFSISCFVPFKSNQLKFSVFCFRKPIQFQIIS